MPSPARDRPPVSLDAHRVVEFALGLLLILLAVALDYPLGAFVLSAGLGALMAGVGVAATREGRALTGSMHRSIDYAFVALMFVFALAAALIDGSIEAAIVFVVVAVALGALTAATRYVERT